jgi:hypothetical protein
LGGWIKSDHSGIGKLAVQIKVRLDFSNIFDIFALTLLKNSTIFALIFLNGTSYHIDI